MTNRPITPSLITDVNTGFKTSFRGGFEGVKPMWNMIATRIGSTARTEKYSWLGQFPKIREWIGERQVRELTAHEYSVTNKRFESTVEVDADDIRDDQLGIYGPMFEEEGRAVAAFPDELIFGLLALANATRCYDGQYFFDTDHPMGEGVASNVQAGVKSPWFLLDCSRALKPLIYQEREAFDFVALDNPNDPTVFWKNKFTYGTTGRANAGLGFWQMAYASYDDLDAENYELARKTMASFKDDEGKPLGARGTILVHTAGNEGPARRLLLNDTLPQGGANEWKGTATPLQADWIADV